MDVTGYGAGGRVKLPAMVDQSLSFSKGTIERVELGLYAWLIVSVDDGRRVRVEPMDVTFAQMVERLDGSEVPVYAEYDGEDMVRCTCGMPDQMGVVDGSDCRSLGCDPVCPTCGPEE